MSPIAHNWLSRYNLLLDPVEEPHLLHDLALASVRIERGLARNLVLTELLRQAGPVDLPPSPSSRSNPATGRCGCCPRSPEPWQGAP